ncbi:hypothetical protein [Paenibacillus sp. 1001270B_150601_E10]|uniref:hypothetical protein n=1 Tax=Paenibacillus sp. 1001270B_150601_E10 TaxID=2787079 RepID=UPI00189EACDD|nr:hypothetical protein [Paenibacillus sp. 1001270B_150601_E10]
MELLFVIIGAFLFLLVLGNQYTAIKKMEQLQRSLDETNRVLNLVVLDKHDTLEKRIH